MRLSILLCGATALWTTPVPAQSPVTDTLLVDIETSPSDTPYSSEPQLVAESGGMLWLSAASRDEGRELWRMDGTRNGTRRVTDLAAGQAGSDPAPITAAIAGQPAASQSVLPNGTVLFAATSDSAGRELWAIDPGATTVRLVRDIRPGTEGSDPGYGVSWHGEFWFLADDGQNGIELWRTDGTTAGTVLGENVGAGAASVLYGNENLIVAAGKLWFRATVQGNLWVKDTPSTPARIVADIGQGPVPVFHAAGVSGGLVFANADPVDGTEPWFSDGTPTGTRRLADLRAGPNGSFPYVLGSDGARVWFRADDGIYGGELYVSDGTTAGTRRVTDIGRGAQSGLPAATPSLLDPVSGDLLFVADDQSTGEELYRSDGTTAGTRRLADIDPGLRSSFLEDLRLVGRTVLFSAGVLGQGRELHSCDLQSDTTMLLAEVQGGPDGSDPTVVGTVGQIVVLAARTGRGGVEPWTTQLQPGTARLLRDLFPGPTSSGSNPQLFGRWRDKVFFSARTSSSGQEPWVTDGSAAGTLQLADLAPGPDSFNPVAAGATEHGFVFTDRFALLDAQLWISDGTPAGTRRLPRFDANRRLRTLDVDTAHHGRIFFRVDETTRGSSGWVSDGSLTGTIEIVPPNGGVFVAVAPLGEHLTLGVGTATAGDGLEPWVSDGTPGGTLRLADVYPGNTTSGATGFTEVGGGAVFVAEDGTHGRELWFTRGTPASTRLLEDIVPGSIGSYPQHLTRVGDRVVFLLTLPSTGEELWVTDGTAVGTRLLIELVAGPGDASPRYLTSVGDRTAWFWADPSGTGPEMWITDGTAAGTRALGATPAPGQTFETTYVLGFGNGPQVYFHQGSAEFGDEFWTSDGTAAGTRPLTDTNRGPRDGDPYDSVRLADLLLFSADDGDHGRELHALELGAAGAWVASPYGTGCGTDLDHEGAPVLGGVLDLVSASQTSAAVVFAFGITPSWLDLAPGCALHLGNPIAVAAGIPDPSGRAVLTIPVPNQPALLGDLLHFQTFSVLGSGELRGSNGLEVVLGL